MVTLPTERSVVQNYNPKLLVLFGKPKSGKSSLMASLDSNLIIDLEDGYRALSVMAVQARTAKDLFEIRNALQAKINETGSLPYRFITIDNATRLEEMSLAYAAHKYRNTPMGAGFGQLKDKDGKTIKGPDGKPKYDLNADVRKLPNGGGWLYLREAIKELVNMFKPMCDTLILICHVKDKLIKKDAEEMSEMAVDLAGKTGDIICGEADAIGYVYREGKATYISFEGGDNIIREARPLHLRGKKFEVIKSDADNNLTINMEQLFV